MAKKKNRNKDFDSWLESINSNTYIPQMAQNAPNNANLYGFGSWMGNMFSKPFDAISRRRSAKEFEAYENEHPVEGVSNGTGALNMQPSGQTWGNTNGPSIPMTQTEYNSNPTGSNEFNNDLSLNNPYFSSGNRESRKAARDLRIEALNERTDNGEGFLGRMNTNSGFNMGALPGLAAETARVWSDPNSTKLDKVANAFGIANISKLYSADIEKGDAKINEMTGRLNDFKQNNIQDAWDTLGAGQALKLNKGPNQIKLMDPYSLGVKDFKRKGMLGLTLGAMGQGAASGGSVGGAWGAAGGALSGLFAGIGGMFGRKRRAKKAYKAWQDNINYLNNNARMLNAVAQNEWTASNVNAIKNGVGQEKINDMANFRAYGGILDNEQNINAMGGYFDTFNLSPNMINMQNQSLDNQKYKYNNQMQPIGFMNNINNKFSFGGTLFDDGGYGDFNKYGDNAPLFERLKQESDSVSNARYSAFMNSLEYSALDEELNNDIENAYKNYYDSYGSTHSIYNPNYQGNAMVLFGQFLNNKKLIPDSKVDELYNIAKKNELDVTKNQIREKIANKLVEQYYAHRKLVTGEEDVNLGPSFQKWMNKRSDLLNSFDKSLSDYNNNNTDNEENNINAPDKIEYKGRVLTRDYYGDYHDVNDSYYTLQKQDAIDALSKGDATEINNTSIDNTKTIQNGADLDDVVAKYMQENGIEDKSNTQNTVKRQKNTGRPTQRYSGYQQLSNMLGNEDAIKDFQRSRGIEVDGKVGNETASEMQRFLNEQGYNLKVDGIFGEKTRQAYEDYTRKYNQDRYTEEKQRDLYEEPYFDINEAKNEFFSNTPYAMGGKINRFDFGGSMNGMDLPTGMQSYDAGGTHEENPNGGVQVGVDQQGNPNLVEEGEFRWGDYVFSDRILVDEDILSLYNAELNPNRSTKRKAKKGKLTYADLAKKYANKNKELVNDPIGKSTIDKYMENLSHAEEDQKMRAEEEKADRDYNNALANQTQGNPMYGSMKYNGMGNANTGLNEGNAAMGGMDNSGLSNVNRSGNEMLHAFGGNLYEGGGPILTMGKDGLYHYKGDDGRDYTLSPNEVEIVNGVPTPAQNTSLLGMRDADGNIVTVNPQTGQMSNGTVIDPSTLDVNQPGYNYAAPTSKDFGLSLTGSNPTSGYLYTGDNLPYDIHYGTKVDAVTGNPYLSQSIINPLWDKQGNKMLGNKPMPNGAHRDMYRFLDNSAITPGMNNNINGHGESNYVPRHLEVNYQGPFGSTFRETNPFNPDKPQTPPVNNPPAQDTPPAVNVPPAKEGPNTNTGGGNSNTGNGGTSNPPDTGNGGGNNSGMRTNIDVTGNPGNLNAQYAAGNPWQSIPYQEWTRFGAMAKGLPWVNSDAMGHTNWKYKIDNVPPDRMEALGKTGLALRNADHSGMFRAPDLMDVERQNNASQSFLANALRGISNVGGGNRGFVGAQSAAQNYNAQMGIGNNYATTNAYNADQKLKADEFNKQTEQFNANANNQMEADNQKAKQFAKTYEMTGLQNANAERLHERNYKDAVDRVAAADRANNVTNMWDNALNFMANEAKMNHEYNMFNSDATQQYYWDKNKRQFIFKDDPNNPMIRMNNILRRENMGALSANSQKLLNSYIQQYGNNVPQKLLDGLVEIEKQEQQRLADEKKATTNAGYRDLENEYDMLLADYARRMNTKAEDGKTPKFANYTKDDYGVFEDLRTNRPVDEKGNPISDDDYYSRLRMRANMMRNMMYGANSYYNVGAYGGKICTRKKKQHYYMDV